MGNCESLVYEVLSSEAKTIIEGEASFHGLTLEHIKTIEFLDGYVSVKLVRHSWDEGDDKNYRYLETCRKKIGHSGTICEVEICINSDKYCKPREEVSGGEESPSPCVSDEITRAEAEH